MAHNWNSGGATCSDKRNIFFKSILSSLASSRKFKRAIFCAILPKTKIFYLSREKGMALKPIGIGFYPLKLAFCCHFFVYFFFNFEKFSNVDDAVFTFCE